MASFSFSYYLEGQETRRKFWGQMKKVLIYISFLGLIVVATFFIHAVEKLHRTSLIFVSEKNELCIIEVVSKGQLKGCVDGPVDQYENLLLMGKNFRIGEMEKGIAYVNQRPNNTHNIEYSDLYTNSTIFYNILDIQIWEKQAPDNLREQEIKCKKCLTNSGTCNHLLLNIPDLSNCKGDIFR